MTFFTQKLFTGIAGFLFIATMARGVDSNELNAINLALAGVRLSTGIISDPLQESRPGSIMTKSTTFIDTLAHLSSELATIAQFPCAPKRYLIPWILYDLYRTKTDIQALLQDLSSEDILIDQDKTEDSESLFTLSNTISAFLGLLEGGAFLTAVCSEDKVGSDRYLNWYLHGVASFARLCKIAFSTDMQQANLPSVKAKSSLLTLLIIAHIISLGYDALMLDPNRLITPGEQEAEQRAVAEQAEAIRQAVAEFDRQAALINQALAQPEQQIARARQRVQEAEQHVAGVNRMVQAAQGAARGEYFNDNQLLQENQAEDARVENPAQGQINEARRNVQEAEQEITAIRQLVEEARQGALAGNNDLVGQRLASANLNTARAAGTTRRALQQALGAHQAASRVFQRANQPQRNQQEAAREQEGAAQRRQQEAAANRQAERQAAERELLNVQIEALRRLVELMPEVRNYLNQGHTG